MATKLLSHVSVVTEGLTEIGVSIAEALIVEGAKRVYITGR